MHVWIIECGDLAFTTKARSVQALIMESTIKLSYSISYIGHKWIMGRDLAKPLDALVSQDLN
jgi:hypothetical protein